MGLAANLTERHKSGGLTAFKPDEGIKAMEFSLNQAAAHLIVIKADWQLVHAPQYLVREAYYSEISGKAYPFRKFEKSFIPRKKRHSNQLFATDPETNFRWHDLPKSRCRLL